MGCARKISEPRMRCVRNLVLAALLISSGSLNFLARQIVTEHVRMPRGRAASSSASTSKSSKSSNHVSFGVIALVSVSPVSAQAQSDQSDDFQLDPTLIFSVVLVFGTIAAGLSWVAGLKPKKFQDGQPRSTSLYRVFQARMRAGEFAALAEEKAAPGGSEPENPEDAELDAFVDAYVDALEDEESEQTDSGKIEKDGKKKPSKPFEKRESLS